MKHLKSIFTLLLFVCLLIMTPAFADDDGDDSTGRDDIQYYPVTDNVDMISTLKFDYGRHRIVIKSVFPQLQGDPGDKSIDNFNQLVTELVEQQIAQFRSMVEQNQPVQRRLANPKIRNDFYIDYDASIIKSGKNPLISIRFSMQSFIDGIPQPYHYHKVLNYDFNNGQKIELSDLFSIDANYLAAFADYTSNELLRHLSNKETVMNGTAPKDDNFSNWNIKPNGILITFDTYKVAPHVQGAQTVLVPYSVLKRIMATDSVIYSCVKNPKTCARSNTLVGGFIDTAVNTQYGGFNPVLSEI